MTAPSSEFESFVLEQIGTDVSVGSFFGGRAFKRGGTQFAFLMGNTLYLRTRSADREAMKSAGSEPFSYNTKRGRVTVASYYPVPGEWLENPETLQKWIRKALDASAKTGAVGARRAARAR